MKLRCDGSRVGVRLIRARAVTCEGEQLRCIVSRYEYVWNMSSVTIEREILALVPYFP
jgi:hypothetical protein